jgi:F-type H+-transporting ATPase subunit b
MNGLTNKLDSRRPGLLLCACTATYLFLGEGLALAAEAAHGAEPDAHGAAAAHGGGHGAAHAGGLDYILSSDFWLHWPTKEDGRTGFLYICINFLVLMFILNKILFKNLVNSNREKSDHIKLELERASEARARAESLVGKYEERLSSLATEVDDIRKNAEEQAKKDGERIVAEAREDAAKMKRAAADSAEREGIRRQREIEAEVVDRAMAKAEQAIRQSFGAADQGRLLDAYVNEVGAADLGGKKAS